MTDREILDFVKRIDYAPLYISMSLNCRRCGPGQEQWKHDLASLNETERFLLSARIRRHLSSSVKEGEAR